MKNSKELRKNPRRTLILDIPLLRPESSEVIARAADFSPEGAQIYTDKIELSAGQLVDCLAGFPPARGYAPSPMPLRFEVVWAGPDAKGGWTKAGIRFVDLDADSRLRLLDEIERFSAGIYLNP